MLCKKNKKVIQKYALEKKALCKNAKEKMHSKSYCAKKSLCKSADAKREAGKALEERPFQTGCANWPMPNARHEGPGGKAVSNRLCKAACGAGLCGMDPAKCGPRNNVREKGVQNTAHSPPCKERLHQEEMQGNTA